MGERPSLLIWMRLLFLVFLFVCSLVPVCLRQTNKNRGGTTVNVPLDVDSTNFNGSNHRCIFYQRYFG